MSSRKCRECGAQESSKWRRGQLTRWMLCNRCGMRDRRCPTVPPPGALEVDTLFAKKGRRGRTREVLERVCPICERSGAAMEWRRIPGDYRMLCNTCGQALLKDKAGRTGRNRDRKRKRTERAETLEPLLHTTLESVQRDIIAPGSKFHVSETAVQKDTSNAVRLLLNFQERAAGKTRSPEHQNDSKHCMMQPDELLRVPPRQSVPNKRRKTRQLLKCHDDIQTSRALPLPAGPTTIAEHREAFIGSESERDTLAAAEHDSLDIGNVMNYVRPRSRQPSPTSDDDAGFSQEVQGSQSTFSLTNIYQASVQKVRDAAQVVAPCVNAIRNMVAMPHAKAQNTT